jgi:hypothetical protein
MKQSGRDASRHGRLFSRAFQYGLVDEARDRCAEERRQPEEPELLQRPAAHENRRSGAARRIHRRVRHWNADQMNQRKRKTDRKPAVPTGARR